MIELYEYFIRSQVETITFYFNLLHDVHVKRLELYNIIRKHKDYLYFIGFPYDKLEEFMYNDRRLGINMSEYDFDDTVQRNLLKSNIITFVNLSTRRIPTIEEKIAYHNYLVSISFKTFSNLFLILNNEISSHIIKGRLYDFSNGIGSIKVYRFNRNFKKKSVDWGRSNEQKKITPDRYLMYHLDDEYVAAKYIKSKARVQNYKYYRFKLTSYINTKDRSKNNFYKSVECMEDIFKETKVGNLEKVLAVTHLETPKFYDKHDI